MSPGEPDGAYRMHPVPGIIATNIPHYNNDLYFLYVNKFLDPLPVPFLQLYLYGAQLFRNSTKVT